MHYALYYKVTETENEEVVQVFFPKKKKEEKN